MPLACDDRPRVKPRWRDLLVQAFEGGEIFLMGLDLGSLPTLSLSDGAVDAVVEFLLRG